MVRTGLLVALALAAVGVPDAVIRDDYARSGTQVRRLLTGLALDRVSALPIPLHTADVMFRSSPAFTAAS